MYGGIKETANKQKEKKTSLPQGQYPDIVARFQHTCQGRAGTERAKQNKMHTWKRSHGPNGPLMLSSETNIKSQQKVLYYTNHILLERQSTLPAAFNPAGKQMWNTWKQQMPHTLKTWQHRTIHSNNHKPTTCFWPWGLACRTAWSEGDTCLTSPAQTTHLTLCTYHR